MFMMMAISIYSTGRVVPPKGGERRTCAKRDNLNDETNVRMIVARNHAFRGLSVFRHAG